MRGRDGPGGEWSRLATGKVESGLRARDVKSRPNRGLQKRRRHPAAASRPPSEASTRSEDKPDRDTTADAEAAAGALAALPQEGQRRSGPFRPFA